MKTGVTHSPPKTVRVRAGVTLMEVLMSMMIMSIGVTSVMSLFPIAALRSAQATKLTNSALLRYNVEALLNARPELIFDPDGDGNLEEHYRGANRNYIVDPLGYFSAFEYAGGGNPGRLIAERMGNDGAVAHANALRRFDGGILSRFGIDPDLFNTVTSDELRAYRLVGAKDSQLGDTWDTQFDFTLDNPAGDLITDANGEVVGIVIPLDIIPDANALALVQTSATELSSIGGTISDPETHRITLFSGDGKLSQTYPLLQVNASRNATWSESVVGADVNGDGHIENRPIPREFKGVVGRILIQSKRAADFTWMLTVRRAADGQARSVDVVVRFGDRLKLSDEYLYAAVFRAQRTYVTGSFVSVPGVRDPVPALKRGGYIFDVTNARWYRIREFEISEIVADRVTFNVTLEKPASKDGNGALILPGIVDVYPMGSRNMP